MTEMNTNKPGKLKFALIGNGSWATALAKILTDNGHQILWWMRKPEAVQHLIHHHHNPNYLSSVGFPPDLIFPSNNLDEVLSKGEIILLATPSAYIQPIIDQMNPKFLEGKIVISAVKGVLPEKHVLINDYLAGQHNFPMNRYCAISGPCHAEEVAEERLSYLTFSSLKIDLAKKVSGLFNNEYIHTSATHDLWGCQYASVLKNIYAIGAGMARGNGYGDNFLSVYATNCYHEMYSFLVAQFDQLHPSKEYPDFHTSAYLGDLLVTCYSPFSRNRTLGVLMGKGYSVKAACTEMSMVAEGYFAAKSMKKVISGLGLSLSIVDCIYEALWENKPVENILERISKILS